MGGTEPMFRGDFKYKVMDISLKALCMQFILYLLSTMNNCNCFPDINAASCQQCDYPFKCQWCISAQATQIDDHVFPENPDFDHVGDLTPHARVQVSKAMAYHLKIPFEAINEMLQIANEDNNSLEFALKLVSDIQQIKIKMI